MIYCDAAASTPVRPEVLAAIWPLLSERFGNPSSHHTVGEDAAAALADARQRIAGLLGCRASEIIFTSGGTEAINLALKGIALANPRSRHIVSSAVEHPAVTQTLDYLRRMHDFRITTLPVNGDGLVDPGALGAALTPETTLCTLMYANNEVGSIQPIAECAALCRDQGVPFHSDAVQAAGWLPLDVEALGVDALSVSGHKIGAPQGTGFLYLRRRIRVEPVLHGGGQERGHHSGTQNVAGAVGLAVALELAQRCLPAAAERSAQLRDKLVSSITTAVPGARVTGHPSRRLPALASFCFPGIGGEAVLLELERRGIVSSSGSACAAGSTEPSAVLLALGLSPEDALTALRLSWTAQTSDAELAEVASAVVSAIESVQKIAGPAGTLPERESAVPLD